METSVEKEPNEGLSSGEKIEWKQDTKTLEGINVPGLKSSASQVTCEVEVE